MNYPVTIIVSSDSSEKLHEVKKLIYSEADLEKQRADVGTAKDRVWVQHYRNSDFLSAVQITDKTPESFELVFVPIHDANRFWKDVVAKILTSITIKAFGVSIRFKIPSPTLTIPTTTGDC